MWVYMLCINLSVLTVKLQYTGMYAVSMLGQRRRQWPSIKTALG